MPRVRDLIRPERFLAYAKKQSGAYRYDNRKRCPMAKYFRDKGYTWAIVYPNHVYPVGDKNSSDRIEFSSAIEDALIQGPWTWEDLTKRLEAVVANKGAQQ